MTGHPGNDDVLVPRIQNDQCGTPFCPCRISKGERQQDNFPRAIFFHPSNPVVNGIGLAVTGEELLRRQARPGSPFLRIGGFADQQDDPNNLIHWQDCRKGIRQYESSIWGYPDRKFVCFHPAFGHIRATQERAAGIEPATAAWKAAAIPFCNARVRHSAALRGSLPAYAPLRCASWLTTNRRQSAALRGWLPTVGAAGLEPATPASQTQCASVCATPRPCYKYTAFSLCRQGQVSQNCRATASIALRGHGAQESRWFCQLGISAPRVTSGRRFPPSGDIR